MDTSLNSALHYFLGSVPTVYTYKCNALIIVRSQTFFKIFWNFSVDFCPPWPKVWNFFYWRTFQLFTHPHTPGSMMWVCRWCDVSLRPWAFPSSLNRGCGVVEENMKKFQTFGHGWKVGWPKVIYHLRFFDVVRKSKIWNFENEYFGFRMVATTVTLRPPSRWYSEETPPRGGPHGYILRLDELFFRTCDFCVALKIDFFLR